MIDLDLTGRTALVTGSAKGVGRELLLALADRGASVAVHYNTSADAASEVAETAREHGVDVTTVQADVTDPDAVDDCFATASGSVTSAWTVVTSTPCPRAVSATSLAASALVL